MEAIMRPWLPGSKTPPLQHTVLTWPSDESASTPEAAARMHVTFIEVQLMPDIIKCASYLAPFVYEPDTTSGASVLRGGRFALGGVRVLLAREICDEVRKFTNGMFDKLVAMSPGIPGLRSWLRRLDVVAEMLILQRAAGYECDVATAVTDIIVRVAGMSAERFKVLWPHTALHMAGAPPPPLAIAPDGRPLFVPFAAGFGVFACMRSEMARATPGATVDSVQSALRISPSALLSAGFGLTASLKGMLGAPSTADLVLPKMSIVVDLLEAALYPALLAAEIVAARDAHAVSNGPRNTTRSVVMLEAVAFRHFGATPPPGSGRAWGDISPALRSVIALACGSSSGSATTMPLNIVAAHLTTLIKSLLDCIGLMVDSFKSELAVNDLTVNRLVVLLSSTIFCPSVLSMLVIRPSAMHTLMSLVGLTSYRGERLAAQVLHSAVSYLQRPLTAIIIAIKSELRSHDGSVIEYGGARFSIDKLPVLDVDVRDPATETLLQCLCQRSQGLTEFIRPGASFEMLPVIPGSSALLAEPKLAVSKSATVARSVLNPNDDLEQPLRFLSLPACAAFLCRYEACGSTLNWPEVLPVVETANAASDVGPSLESALQVVGGGEIDASNTALTRLESDAVSEIGSLLEGTRQVDDSDTYANSAVPAQLESDVLGLQLVQQLSGDDMMRADMSPAGNIPDSQPPVSVAQAHVVVQSDELVDVLTDRQPAQCMAMPFSVIATAIADYLDKVNTATSNSNAMGSVDDVMSSGEHDVEAQISARRRDVQGRPGRIHAVLTRLVQDTTERAVQSQGPPQITNYGERTVWCLDTTTSLSSGGDRQAPLGYIYLSLLDEAGLDIHTLRSTGDVLTAVRDLVSTFLPARIRAMRLRRATAWYQDHAAYLRARDRDDDSQMPEHVRTVITELMDDIPLLARLAPTLLEACNASAVPPGVLTDREVAIAVLFARVCVPLRCRIYRRLNDFQSAVQALSPKLHSQFQTRFEHASTDIAEWWRECLLLMQELVADDKAAHFELRLRKFPWCEPINVDVRISVEDAAGNVGRTCASVACADGKTWLQPVSVAFVSHPLPRLLRTLADGDGRLLRSTLNTEIARIRHLKMREKLGGGIADLVARERLERKALGRLAAGRTRELKRLEALAQVRPVD